MLIGSTAMEKNSKVLTIKVFFLQLQDITIIECYCSMRGYLCNNEWFWFVEKEKSIIFSSAISLSVSPCIFLYHIWGFRAGD